MKTLVQGGTIVAFNGKSHTLIPNGYLIFEDDRVTEVAQDLPASPQQISDRQLDARGMLVCPGFINSHIHSGINAGDALLGDVTRRDYFGGNYMSFGAPLKGAPRPRGSDYDLRVRFGLLQALRGGATTMIDVGISCGNPDRFVELVGEVGLRVYASPGYRSAEIFTDRHGRFVPDWDEERGRQGMKNALAFCERYEGALGGRLRCMLFPRQVHLCTPELLKASRQAATDLKIPMQIHAAMNLWEFNYTMAEYRKTPIGYLKDLGFLGPDVILGHCIFTSGHSWVNYPGDDDVQAIAESGATISHSASKYAKIGIALESFQRHIDRGVRISLATDTNPFDLVTELRAPAYMSRSVDRDHLSARPADIFNSATLAGADALGRSDLGRLCQGAKADMLFIDQRRLMVGGVLDPIQAMIESGNAGHIDTILVDGKILVQGGKVLGLDETDFMERVQKECEGTWEAIPNWHFAGLRADQMCPPTYPAWSQPK